MMKLKSFLAALVVCATVLTTTLPALAASSSFQDVTDPVTAVNADVLRLMGAVSGSGSNQFSPDAKLTRAEFCVMAINLMGKSDQVPIHTTRTIFQDVTARHWARGYVNLAASISIGKDDAQTGSRLISGVGNGQFLPDAQITYAQAVTILMRMLGYSDDQVGAVWPAGYLNLADSLGLTEGLSLASGAPISRAQAAQLFVNLLSTKNASGAKYYTSLGTASENVVLMAVNVEADDKTGGAIRTSQGTYLPAVEGVAPTALLGQRGTLILNDRDQIVTFLPDGSTSVTITLSGNAQASGLTAASGDHYAISPSTPAFTGSGDDASTYANIWVDLYSGAQVTLFLDGGKVIGVYYSVGSASSEDAVVLQGNASHAAFLSLTGGVENYTIQKNNQTIRMSDIQPYDVVTYDSVHNTLVVSDLRLTCIYESAQPNSATPSTIHALGHDFPVLESALSSINDFAPGSSITMLLTADGRVAGLVKPSTKTRSTALGLADSNSVDMLLPAGGSIKLTSSQALSDRVAGKVVSIASSKAGIISATALSNRSASGDLDLTSMTLGNYTVTAGVSVFEQVNGGAAVPLSLASLGSSVIASNKIATYHLNSSDMVDLIVLTATTGDSYQYGRYTVVDELTTDPDTGNPVHTDVAYFETSQGSKIKLAGFININYGDFVGVVLRERSDGKQLILSNNKLTKVTGISRTDFFQSQGNYYVNANGTTYLVADDVGAYNNTTKLWFTGSDVLSSIRAYSDDLTIYVDPIGEKVRIVTTK